MTINQQDHKFIQDLTEDLGRWSQKPTTLMIGLSALITLVFIGGLFFWASQMSSVFDRSSNQNQLEVARSGLQTMKRMVGNQQVWSESIQEEYNRIFANQSAKIQPVSYINSNFLEASYFSVNKISAK